jgi:hypothetical protein
MRIRKLLGADKYYCLECRKYHNISFEGHKIHKAIPTLKKFIKSL